MENPEALGFHQEQMETTEDPIEQTETMEDSKEIPGLVLYQTLFYFFLRKITTSFSYNTKFKIQVIILMCLTILLSKHDT